MFFFFNDTATTEIYTLSLHDALPILGTTNNVARSLGLPLTVRGAVRALGTARVAEVDLGRLHLPEADRKSTRLNSSHANISYAVFCLKKKKNNIQLNSITK